MTPKKININDIYDIDINYTTLLSVSASSLGLDDLDSQLPESVHRPRGASLRHWDRTSMLIQIQIQM